MKIKKYIGLTLALMAAMGITSCQDDFSAPGMHIPVASLQANTTIADVKLKYWNSADNYIDTIKVADGETHPVIAGRVISSDQTGNIYKNLVIQDATGALTLSINANSLYTNYRVGQEVVLDLADMYIGKYSTLEQLGFPDYSAAYGWQATFMPLAFFQQHAQLNGLPDPAAIDTMTIAISDLSNDDASMRKYQSQLVRFNNVSFVDGGEKAFCDAHKVNTNRTLKDANGNTIVVRTSGYANYWSLKLPAEAGDVVGILSTYKSGKDIQWQLVMRGPDDLLNFGDPTLPKGTETNPYDIVEGVGQIAEGTTAKAWYTGYIVGSLRLGVTTVESDDDVIWGTDAEVKNTLIIGQTPETTTLSECLLIRLPQDSKLREFANLVDNPDVYGRQIWVIGTPATDLGTNALTGNNGTAKEFRIEGVTVPGDEPGGDGDAIAEGNGSEDSPYNATQVLAMGKSVNQTGQWVRGYIVGFVPDKSLNGAQFQLPATSATNFLIADTPTETDYTKCLPIQLTTTVRGALNLMDNASNFGKVVDLYGDLMAYFGVAGLKNTSKYKLSGTGGGDNPGPDTPATPVTSLDQNFEGVTSTPAGWKTVDLSGNATWFYGNYNNNSFAACTGYGNFKTPGDQGFISWLITPPLNVAGMTSKTFSFESMVGYTGEGVLEVFALTSADPATATATKLNATIPQPTGSWSDWVKSGDISLAGFSGTIYIGFRYTAKSASGYTTYRIDNVKAGAEGSGGGTGGETPDPNPGPGGGDTPITGDDSADLNTLDTKTSYTGEVTTTNGWTLTNCAVQAGDDDPSKQANPIFGYLGGKDVRAAVLNGKASAPGKLVSPTLTGGIKTLQLNYGFSFSETKCKFTVNILQNGTVVKSQTQTIDSVEKFKKFTFTMDCNVTGDYVIEIVNDAYSNASANKDRVSIWNITWTK